MTIYLIRLKDIQVVSKSQPGCVCGVFAEIIRSGRFCPNRSIAHWWIQILKTRLDNAGSGGLGRAGGSHVASLWRAYLFLKRFLFIYFTYISALSACMPALHKMASNRIIDDCEPPCGYWEWESEPLEEQPLHLSVEPSLQPWRPYLSMASLWFFSAFSQTWCEICFSVMLSLPGNENFCDHKQNESCVLLRCSVSHKKAGTRGRYLFSMLQLLSYQVQEGD